MAFKELYSSDALLSRASSLEGYMRISMPRKKDSLQIKRGGFQKVI